MHPLLAVPSGYRVTPEPGGSSQGVLATFPASLGVTVTAWVNACVGCSNPALLAQSVQALTTPTYAGAPQKGAIVTPLGDHA